MLKNKIKTFFKSPIVKNAIIVLTAVIIVASIISIPASKAGSQIERVSFRAAPMNIRAGSREIEMPEVAPGQGNLDQKRNDYSNVFCIQEGNTLSCSNYETGYNLYDSGTSSRYFKNYGAAVWLIDNMYISSAGNSNECLDHLAQIVTAPEVEQNVSAYGIITADNIKYLNKTVGGVSDAYGNVMNRNFIEVIEQMVLWNYTNNSYYVNFDGLVNQGFSGTNIGIPEQNVARYLYYGLKYLANKNSGYRSNGTTSNVVSLDASRAVIDVQNSKVGPYAIKSDGITLNAGSSLKSKISATVTKVDGTTQKLDSNKIIVEDDGTFYVDIAECGQITKSNLEINSMYTGASTKALVLVNGSTQNLLSVKKNVNTKPLADEKTVTYSGEYNIKLIKTKQDGTAITNNPAKFTITGAVTLNGEDTDSNGVLTIASKKTITNVGTTDTYKIVEDEAPEGYTKYDGTIDISVGFKTEGTSYILDKDNVKMTSNGTNGTVKINVENNTIEVYVPNTEIKKETPVIDLALRKYISKIDGRAVEISREPVIDAESKAILDKTNTAAYHHTKQSLKVKAGSQIEYTIRIYNEGKVDGVAKVIKDYLPEGLTFVKIADGSSNLYTTSSKAGSKEIELVYTGSDVIRANSIERILNNDTKNAYQEVKVICKVEKGAKGYLTNRAEITKYGYTDGENIWHEAKAIGDCDRDSVQNTIANSLGLDTWYVNAKNFSYVENGTTKEVEDYYPGVQDDDDFETVEVEPEEKIDGSFKIRLRKVDSSNKNQGLEGAYFKTNIGFATLKIGPTDPNGYVDFITSGIKFEGEKFSYSLYESEAPEGYEKYEKEIKLDVATKREGNEYVIDQANTKLANQDEKVSLDLESNLITIIIADDKEKADFDLALRKFITNIDGKEITSRIPKVTLTDDFKSGKVTTAKYEHSKEPLQVETDNVVVYTIRIYNEGDVDGYATKVMDDIPDGLEFLPENSINKDNGWVMYSKVDKVKIQDKHIIYGGEFYVETTDATKADLIVTKKLENELIKAYNPKTMETLDYKDVKVAFKVVEPNSSDRIITNYAQITEHKDKKGNTTVKDRDSTPNVWNEGEDDQDIEKIKLREKEFDLALRKFITNIDGKEITSRIPKVTLTDDFKSGKITTATYEHSKEPLDVVQDQIIVYTIRVYNEGEVDGYATKVMDDIPDGLEFLPEHEINANKWVMYVESNEKVEGSITYNKKNYVPTTDAKRADLIVTEQLKDQLIKAYNPKTMETLDYKDVKVAFKVVEKNTSDRIITNYAQITENKDKKGKVVKDRDSVPNEWNEGEDDQDIEKIKLRYFDLALRKWVTEAIVIENGQTSVFQTGHKAEDDPESIVKVDLKKSKLKDITVKFRYSIRVTNQGEIAGYAKEVTDYIPEGLRFEAADNPSWKLVDGNNAVTDALADTLLNPGESAEVTIVLTWINSQSNMGVKINTAEITKDYNKYGAKDIDSTPGNKVPGEDDIDDAPVMLTVKTGSEVIGYVGIAVAFLAIIGAGVYVVKKHVM